MARSTAARRAADQTPDSHPVPKRLASLENARKYMDVADIKTVRRYIASGLLTGYRMGDRLLRVDLNEVDQMLRPIPTGGQNERAAG